MSETCLNYSSKTSDEIDEEEATTSKIDSSSPKMNSTEIGTIVQTTRSFTSTPITFSSLLSKVTEKENSDTLSYSENVYPSSVATINHINVADLKRNNTFEDRNASPTLPQSSPAFSKLNENITNSFTTHPIVRNFEHNPLTHSVSTAPITTSTQNNSLDTDIRIQNTINNEEDSTRASIVVKVNTTTEESTTKPVISEKITTV